ncbi:hypothetical protein TPY_0897 [Sulfobacillus acidophilus TPY]|nr:hypothetical protein TPY_0897 [Sulfobacillus acidophilus TPY]
MFKEDFRGIEVIHRKGNWSTSWWRTGGVSFGGVRGKPGTGTIVAKIHFG